MKFLFSIFFCLSLSSFSIAQLSFSVPTDNPEELGKVNWLRNYDDAVVQSQKSDKPILILFQEVPGCATCRNFGNDVLTHPFIVEIVETYFIPLAVFNNTAGHDRKILNQFNEPTWNNPVIRVVDHTGKDLVDRLGRNWTELNVSYSITNTLNKLNQSIPEYFQIYQNELIGHSGKVEEANLAMYCFWTGEKELANIDGILSTEPGFMHGREVVKIQYNPYETNLNEIVAKAEKVNCADEVYVNKKEIIKLNIPVKSVSKYRVDNDNKYYLSRSPYKIIPMSALQASKVNSAIGSGLNPENYLSPRQIELFNYLKNNYSINLIGTPLINKWYELIK